MIRKLVSYILKTVAAYTIVGFVAVPPLLHTGIILFGNQLLTKEVKLGAVYFNPLTLNLTLIAVDIQDTLKLASTSVDLSWKDLKRAIVPEGNIREVRLDKILIESPESQFALNEDGQHSFARLLKDSDEEETSKETLEPSSETSLQFTVNQVAIEHGKFRFTDHQFTNDGLPLFLNIDQLNIYGTALGWPAAHSEINFSTRLNKGAEIHSQITLDLSEHLSETTASASIQLNQINLTDFQPIVNRFTYIDLMSGTFNTQATVNWQQESGLQVISDITIDQLQLDDVRTGDTFASWLQLQLNQLSYQQQSNRLNIDQLQLAAPTAVVAVDEKLQVNLASLIKSVNESEENNKKETTNNALSENTVPEFSLAINRLTIENGAMDFSDRSFQPGFATPIVNLNGEVDGFDTQSQKPATIKIDGRVDRYAPVTIRGAINPSSPMDMADLAMSFTNVELTTLTPYSGRFAGYTIRKGRLHLDLNYQIKDHQLFATNQMLLDKLLLGSRVNSNEAVDLPIRLALALLKDRNGQIDITLPVSGDLDNPEFELGPVIRTALFNLITNIISAPFDLLASLVGGDAEEMKFVNFEPGNFNINRSEQIESLDKLAKALRDRPGLQLEVSGKTAKDSDWPMVAKSLLDKELTRQWARELHEQKKPVPEKLVLSTMDDETRLRLLQQIVENMSSTETLDIDVQDSTTDVVTRQLLTQWPFNEHAMRQLAIDRAREIKDYLIDEGGLEPERIFLLNVQSLAEGSAEKPSTELQLNAG
ncbi:DUF748 domain-containing protein [Endozoicomonas elysicola]|uniref:DUF748 domain-containing protein n=1 Tax=Endozoicomonas elysicola TaxID=305900 RepID=A0A081K8U7_9GAMM|nr:DUF748 domain-containing protein [Endozoicomonas elysicola]KEI70573.1 hypothetical protein GV64_07320 [Endozoicomonas elysicola]